MLTDSKKLNPNFFKNVFIVENDETFLNTNPKCEPNLGKRGLYTFLGGQKQVKNENLAIFWILNYSDGTKSLSDISLISNIRFEIIYRVASALLKANLLKLSK